MRNDPETAATAELLPDEPELLPENEQSLELWRAVGDQVRVGWKGPYSLDLAAVGVAMEAFDVADRAGELVKMKKLFWEIYRNKEK